MKEAIDAARIYVCRICGKEFDEGRKLGGHVSRAHKGASQFSIPGEEELDDSETYRPPANKRRRNKVELDEEETGIKKVKLAEPIYE